MICVTRARRTVSDVCVCVGGGVFDHSLSSGFLTMGIGELTPVVQCKFVMPNYT